MKKWDERKSRHKKKGKKHSRKDIASYAFDERGVTFEISERRDANGARKKVTMVKEEEGKILSRGKK